jgi:gamma-glutamylcyclotransferase (GGCT)/AIG2-like uncharacterized protein YtfP
MTKRLVSVYGSLRKGMGNDHYLTHAKFLGTFTTEPEYSLYSLGGYPGLKQEGTTPVVMEVYEVDALEASRIDGLEGYSQDRPATFYDKIKINTPYGEASTYVYVDEIPASQLVESGDWKEFRDLKTRYRSLSNN